MIVIIVETNRLLLIFFGLLFTRLGRFLWLPNQTVIHTLFTDHWVFLFSPDEYNQCLNVTVCPRFSEFAGVLNKIFLSHLSGYENSHEMYFRIYWKKFKSMINSEKIDVDTFLCTSLYIQSIWNWNLLLAIFRVFFRWVVWCRSTRCP